VKQRLLLSIAAVVLASCSRAGDSGQAAPAVPEPGIPASAVPEIPIPRFPEGGQAEIVRGDTEARILRGTEPLPAEPPTPLALGDRIRTGATGPAEIRLGGLATVLVLPDSEIELRVARLAPGSAHVEVFVASGAALFDVRSLSAGESFLVSSPRTLSGVRGTRFLVSAGSVSVTAVREGRVAVLPSGPVLGRLAAAARTDGAARAALRALVALAPVAEPGREIRVDDPALDRAEAAYAVLESALAGLTSLPLPPGFPEEPWFAAPAQEPPAADPGARESLVRAREAAAAAAPSLAVPVAAGPETLRGFDRFRDFRSGRLSPPPAASGAASGPPHPAELGRTGISSVPLAGSLARIPDAGILLAADGKGVLHAFGPDGGILWSLRTANRGDPRGYPVSFKGTAYYAGNAELVAVDGATGTAIARRGVEPGLDPGTRPAPFPDSLLLPTAAGIDVLDPRTLERRTSIPLAAGPGTLPVQRDSFALVVDREGVLLLVDPVSGTVQARTPTGARGYSAVSPRILEEKACFADATGLVVMVDLERMAVLWERRAGVPVLTDLELAREGVLAYGNGTLFGYRLDGEVLMDPVSGVSAPPLLARGSVYFGTERGELVAAQADPWRIRGTIPLGDVPSARPLLVGDTLYVGTRGGKLVRIDVTKLPR
jgi:outer membrane protein assembly factor BamB